jgi:hypothetical protein
MSWTYAFSANFTIILVDLTFSFYCFAVVVTLFMKAVDPNAEGSMYQYLEDPMRALMYLGFWTAAEAATVFAVLALRVAVAYRLYFLEYERLRSFYYLWLPRLKTVFAVAGFFIFIVTAGFLGEVYRVLLPNDRADDLRNTLGAFFAGLLWCSTLLAVGYGRLLFKNENGWPRFVLNFCLVMLMWPFYIVSGAGHVIASFFEDAAYNGPRIDAFVESLKAPQFRYGVYLLPLCLLSSFGMALVVHILVMPYDISSTMTLGLSWIILKSLQVFVAYVVPLIKILVAGKRIEFNDLVKEYVATFSCMRAVMQLRVQVYLSKVRHVWLINLGVRINESIGLIGEETPRKRDLMERVNTVLRDQAAAKDDLDSSTRALIEMSLEEDRHTRDLERLLEKVAYLLFDYFEDEPDAPRPEEMALVN